MCHVPNCHCEEMRSIDVAISEVLYYFMRLPRSLRSLTMTGKLIMRAIPTGVIASRIQLIL
ncbi:hypothetical protein [Rickettsia felis]|uniref:hypothetical protein n=1 Tax=Rickettsia felis TaxID=42862 RepID=UPI001585CF1A|nr:hypothetical protein [Rickettsia felis]